MKQLTIFTPTYNRKEQIENTYKSLIEQSNKDFIWMIIDDGSTDETEQLVRSWIKEKKIDIVYYKKNNGGKHTAYNVCVENLKTDYVFISLDSDDVLYEKDTIKKILDMMKELKDDEVGVITLCTNSKENTNSFIKKYNTEMYKDKSFSWVCENNAMSAECRIILKSSYAKKFKYPEIEGEKFFTEAFIYWQMKKKFKWTNLNTCYSKYLPDGLSANIKKIFIENPTSWYLYNELRMNNSRKIFQKIKYTIYYISFALLSKNNIFKGKKNKIILFILFPVGYIGKVYLLKNGNKE